MWVQDCVVCNYQPCGLQNYKSMLAVSPCSFRCRESLLNPAEARQHPQQKRAAKRKHKVKHKAKPKKKKKKKRKEIKFNNGEELDLSKLTDITTAVKTVLPAEVTAKLHATMAPTPPAMKPCYSLLVQGSSAQPEKMGLFTMQDDPHNGRPFYAMNHKNEAFVGSTKRTEKKSLVTTFLYASKAGWFIGPTISSRTVSLYVVDAVAQPLYIQRTWTAWSGTGWVKQPRVRMQCICKQVLAPNILSVRSLRRVCLRSVL